MRLSNPLARLQAQPPDALLGLIAAYSADARPNKLDLGVGEYRNLTGNTPIFTAIKKAEGRLLETQLTKGYLGTAGNKAFLDNVLTLLLGSEVSRDEFSAVQTPGGSGALRLAAGLLHRVEPDTRVWIGEPAWANYAAIFEDAGIRVQTYAWFDRVTQQVRFDDLVAALDSARIGDAFLLQGCCHNPTGADLTSAQWRLVTAKLVQNGLLPVLDVAYHGLGDGLDEDSQGARMVTAALENVLIAYSCDKNFGLYRERVGALFVKSTAQVGAVHSNVQRIARGLWSMPPDHGAALIPIVLEDADLRAEWLAELTSMRHTLHALREELGVADKLFGPVRWQKGLFALLPLTQLQIASLCRDHAIYMADSGRINIAGLAGRDIRSFVHQVRACLQAER